MSSVCRCQVLGCAALFGTILPVVEQPFSAKVQAHSYAWDVKVPFMKVRTCSLSAALKGRQRPPRLAACGRLVTCSIRS